MLCRHDLIVCIFMFMFSRDHADIIFASFTELLAQVYQPQGDKTGHQVDDQRKKVPFHGG